MSLVGKVVPRLRVALWSPPGPLASWLWDPAPGCLSTSGGQLYSEQMATMIQMSVTARVN